MSVSQLNELIKLAKQEGRVAPVSLEGQVCCG